MGGSPGETSSRVLEPGLSPAAFRLAFRYIPLHACPLLLQADTHKLLLLPPTFAYFCRFPWLEKRRESQKNRSFSRSTSGTEGSNPSRSTIQSLGFRTFRRIARNPRVRARFAIMDGPRERLGRQWPEIGQTYPGTILLGPSSPLGIGSCREKPFGLYGSVDENLGGEYGNPGSTLYPDASSGLVRSRHSNSVRSVHLPVKPPMLPMLAKRIDIQNGSSGSHRKGDGAKDENPKVSISCNGFSHGSDGRLF